MKLIEALVMLPQEYGIYVRWVTRCGSDGPVLKRLEHDGGWYYGYDPAHVLISQATQLERVLADVAEKYPYEVTRSERWQIALDEEV